MPAERRRKIMCHCKSNYSCIYRLKDPPEIVVWCPSAERIIDDGWGQGNSEPCN
jgi:hypothetical protein